ncbi:MAG: MFS transporter [Spirochaetaceae bacterium]|nr:MFS transporter [Spirochaetaceae bacterium]
MRPGASVHLKRLILPIYLPMFLLSAGISAPVAGFPQYLGGLGASLAIVGLVVSLQGIGNLISDLPGGMILTRMRLRPVMIVCYLTAAGASIGLSLTSNLVVIGALVLVSGTMISVIVTAMMTYVRLTVPATSRGRTLSTVGGSFRAGGLIGPVVGGLLVDSFGLPWTFVLRAVCLAGSVAAVMLSPDRSVGVPKTEFKPGLRKQASLVADGMKGRWFALITVGSAVMILSLLRAARRFALPLWGDALSLNVTTIGLIISAGSAMDFLLFVPAGMIMDRAGRKVAASICIGVFSVGLLLLPLSTGLAGFVIASMVIGLGNGFGAGINMTLGTDLAPRNAVSAFLGLWRLFGDVGKSAGPAVVGMIAAAVGLSASLFVTAGIGAVGLILMALIAPETLHLADGDGPGDSRRRPLHH